MLGKAVRLGAPAQTVAPDHELALGDSTGFVFDTSGHGPEGVNHYCAVASATIAGDSVSAASIGRTDFPGSYERQLLLVRPQALRG